jgi:branched-chain amino acid transport system ATP-binding protein
MLSTLGLVKDFLGLRAVDALDIDVRKGEIHGLIGPNGSGKTTFFNLVSGLIPPTWGKISFDSIDITNLPPHAVTKLGISRTFQSARVLDRMTCLENVMAGLHCRTKADILGTYFRVPFRRSAQENRIEQRAMELLRYVGLEALAGRPRSASGWRTSFSK